MDERLRGKGLLAEKNGYNIQSNNYPNIISSYSIRCRGVDKDKDFKVSSHAFDSELGALEFIENMNALVGELNNITTYVSINADEQYRLDNNNVISVYAAISYNKIVYLYNNLVIKVWFVDNTEKNGQPLKEVIEEFNLFFKRRNIKVVLKDELII